MEYSKFGDLTISKMTLGTVQLGLQYGIANKTGKPDIKTTQEILRYAIKNGINAFDTAPVYGDSEKIIGDFFSSKDSNQDAKPPLIVTKIPFPPDEKAWRYDKIYELMKKSIKQSLQNLNLKKIQIALLHNATVAALSKNNRVIVECLLKLKDEGFIEKLGATVYSPEEVRECLNIKEFNAIQIPLNLLDSRLLHENLLKKLADQNVMIFARSIFLQGLLFLNPNNLPPNLQIASKYLLTLNKIASEFKIPIAQLALCFVRDLPEITSLVIGLETRDQLERNLNLFSWPPLPKGAKEMLLNAFKDIPEKIINPSKWN